MTSNMLGEERSPWGEVLVFLVLLVGRYLGLSALVTSRTWPTVRALLLSVSLPTAAGSDSHSEKMAVCRKGGGSPGYRDTSLGS